MQLSYLCNPLVLYKKMNKESDHFLTFRPANTADIQTLNRISLASKRHWNYPEEWISMWKDDLTLDENDLLNSSVIVLEVRTIVKGFCSIRTNSDHYEVLHLWLLPELIGQGLGKVLLQTSMDRTIEKNLPILVEADPHAEAFYAKQGFVTYDKKESYPKGRYLPLMKMGQLK